MTEPFGEKKMTHFIKYILKRYDRNPVHYKQKRGQEKGTHQVFSFPQFWQMGVLFCSFWKFLNHFVGYHNSREITLARLESQYSSILKILY